MRCKFFGNIQKDKIKQTNEMCGKKEKTKIFRIHRERIRRQELRLSYEFSCGWHSLVENDSGEHCGLKKRCFRKKKKDLGRAFRTKILPKLIKNLFKQTNKNNKWREAWSEMLIYHMKFFEHFQSISGFSCDRMAEGKRRTKWGSFSCERVTEGKRRTKWGTITITITPAYRSRDRHNRAAVWEGEQTEEKNKRKIILGLSYHPYPSQTLKHTGKKTDLYSNNYILCELFHFGSNHCRALDDPFIFLLISRDLCCHSLSLKKI